VADGASPPNKRGPGRWILLGCGILTGLLLLGMGGCAGLFYFIYKSTDPVAEVGADYLRNTPEVSSVLPGKRTVKRQLTGWQVNVTKDAGNARIPYEITCDAPDSTGMATVWLTRGAAAWSVVGARIEAKDGKSITLGTPPREHHRIRWDD
jgi:hypothetical protein